MVAVRSSTIETVVTYSMLSIRACKLPRGSLLEGDALFLPDSDIEHFLLSFRISIHDPVR